MQILGAASAKKQKTLFTRKSGEIDSFPGWEQFPINKSALASTSQQDGGKKAKSEDCWRNNKFKLNFCSTSRDAGICGARRYTLTVMNGTFCVACRPLKLVSIKCSAACCMGNQKLEDEIVERNR